MAVYSSSVAVLSNSENVPFFFSCRQPTLKGDEKPVASVRPVQSTPIPMMPRHVPLGGSVSSASSTNPSMNFPINYLQRAGVLVQKVVTTTGWEFLLSVLGILFLSVCLSSVFLN